jgi:hypothetical protein
MDETSRWLLWRHATHLQSGSHGLDQPNADYRRRLSRFSRTFLATGSLQRARDQARHLLQGCTDRTASTGGKLGVPLGVRIRKFG